MLASDILSGSKEQIARIGATLVQLPATALNGARSRLDRLAMAVSDSAVTCLRPEMSRLDVLAERLTASTGSVIERQRARIERLDGLVQVLSPQATLARGYSITRVNGRAVTSASELIPGDHLVTTLASGTVKSTVDSDR